MALCVKNTNKIIIISKLLMQFNAVMKGLSMYLLIMTTAAVYNMK